MGRGALAVLLGGLLALGVAVAMKTTSKSSGYTCSLTKKHVVECCCIPARDGKVYCTLAKKIADSCCCEADKK